MSIQILFGLIPSFFVTAQDPLFIPVGTVGGILTAVGNIFATIAVVLIIDAAIKESPLNAAQALRMSCTRFWHYVWTMLLLSLACLLGFMLLIIPGIFFGFLFWFAGYITVLRKESGIEALKYSAKIVRGQWWRICGYVLIISLVVTMPVLLIIVPINVVIGTNVALATLFNSLVNTIVISISTTLLTVFFISEDRHHTQQFQDKQGEAE